MRAVFIGAGKLTKVTAQQLLGKGHEVVIIELDKALIEELATELDAGFIHGDGSKPGILREADPGRTDFLFSLSDSDQYNIISSLVGRSLGFDRVVTCIEEPSYEHICIELGLSDVIIPDFTIARFLADMCEGQNPLEVSALIKGDARVFSFIAGPEDELSIADLNLPENSRLAFLYRDDEFALPDAATKLKRGDEVVIVAHSKALPKLNERWSHVLDGLAGAGR